MKIKTSELIGSDLNWAVAVALGARGQETGSKTIKGCKHWVIPGFEPMRWDNWTPSWDWGQGGKLIEKHQIELKWEGIDGKAYWWSAAHQDVAQFQLGVKPLIAAMRAIVAAKLGDEIEVPDELA